MRGMVFTALFTAALLLGAAHAQMRGGFAGGAGGVRGGFVGHAPIARGGLPAVGVRNGFPRGSVALRGGFVGSHGFGFNRFGFCRFGRCFAPSVFPGGFHHRRRLFFGFGFGGFGAFPFFSSLYGGSPYGYGYGLPFDYGYSDYSGTSDYYLADRERLMSDLEDQRQRTQELRDELADLQAAANAAAQTATRAPATAAAPATPSSTEQSLATTLVFRDNRRLEVQNYAIVGDKLYEFAPHWKRTISMSDIDVPATIKANEDRGIRFEVPSKLAKRH